MKELTYKREWMKKWRLEHPKEYESQKEIWSKKARLRYSENMFNVEYRKKKSQIIREWRLLHPEKTRAHRAVFVALRNGTLQKEACFCGEIKVQAHHDDYLKPLEVIWLCRPHHVGADYLRRKNSSTKAPSI